MLTVSVRQRAHDFHARVQNRSRSWDCGSTPDEAVGALVRCNKDQFTLLIVVERRTPLDFKAYTSDYPLLQGYGETSDEAVGAFLRYYGEKFNIKIVSE